ncbi:MAG: 30S ribosomal protein S4e [Candidatus Diapherotrites archaeon]
MAKKGGDRKLKRLNAPSTMHINRKEKSFVFNIKPGPHSKKCSVPLGYLIRDCLGIAKNRREAKIILNEGRVRVNGIVRKSLQFPVGLFDFISIDGLEKEYQMLYDYKGRLYPEEVKNKKKGLVRPSKVIGKRVIKKGKIQLTTDNGNNYIVSNTIFLEAKPNDTLMVKFPENEIIELKRMEPGAKVYITGGPHISKQAIVKDIKPGTGKKGKVVVIKQGDKEFETLAKNVMVIE